MKKSVLHLSNAPTPYRVDLFNAFHDLSKDQIDFNVIYYSPRESNRHWIINRSDIKFPISIFDSKEINIASVRTYLNFNILWSSLSKRPDVVILAGAWHYLPSILLAAVMRLKGKKVYFWSEENEFTGRNGRILVFLKKIVYLVYGSFVVPNNRTVAEIQTFIKKVDSRILRNAIDLELFHPAKHSKNVFCLADAKQSVKFVSVCELSVRKGVDQLVRVFRGLRDEYKIKGIVLSLRIIGTGPLEHDLKNECRGDSDIQFCGNLSKNEVSSCLSESDIFILNSLSDPNPLSVIEAIACGCLPLLSSAVGNCYEFLPKGSPLVFQVGEVESGIREVLSISEDFYVEQMNFLQRIVLNYDVKKVASDLFDII